MTISNKKSAISRNHNESYRTKTCMTISNTKSTIPRNHNESNHEIRENFTTKKFIRKKWLQVYGIETQKNIS